MLQCELDKLQYELDRMQPIKHIMVKIGRALLFEALKPCFLLVPQV